MFYAASVSSPGGGRGRFWHLRPAFSEARSIGSPESTRRRAIRSATPLAPVERVPFNPATDDALWLSNSLPLLVLSRQCRRSPAPPSAPGSFKTLVAAVTAADLVGTLKSPGPFTVFAPTDAAFRKLPKGTVASLLKPENKAKLVKILTYHVVPGKVLACGRRRQDSRGRNRRRRQAQCQRQARRARE